jgi:hypothetical protein
MCCAAYLLYALPKLGWLKCNKTKLQWVTLGLMTDTLRTEEQSSPASHIPPAWLGPARKQLPSDTLARRTALEWVVPRAKLVTALGKEKVAELYSPPVYNSGSALQLYIQVSEAQEGGHRDMGVHILPCDYKHGFMLVAPVHCPLICSCSISHCAPGHEMAEIANDTVTLPAVGWGDSSAFTVASPSDLEPHLVNGCLKLQATVSVWHSKSGSK